MKNKILKILQAVWTATKTTLLIWSDNQMIKHLNKRGYETRRAITEIKQSK